MLLVVARPYPSRARSWRVGTSPGLPSCRRLSLRVPCASTPAGPRPVSPLATAWVLGSADATASPPAFGVSRLDSFSGVRLPLTACEVPCVRFTKVVRLASPSATSACPSFVQHSVLDGWLSLFIQFFSSEPCHVSMPSLRDFHPQSQRPLLGALHFTFLGAVFWLLILILILILIRSS